MSLFCKGIFKIHENSHAAILDKISELVDKKIIRHTMKENLGNMTPENLDKVHERLKGGSVIGKICFDGIE